MNKRQRKKHLKKMQAICRTHFLPAAIRTVYDPMWRDLMTRLAACRPSAPQATAP